jgi:hypothetical protein
LPTSRSRLGTVITHIAANRDQIGLVLAMLS